ncbi:ribosome biogenesis GTPase Der [Candidatus Saccharibacteria bacterium]|nr:MAG: ribosome biogenesis GTPase Der [Candidatus Saccharibacteria bacterium]
MTASQKLPTVAIIGRANAGKSSLFNRLVRSRQAIVASEAGTTRDSVLGTVEYRRNDRDGHFWLVDTAGFKAAEDEFEATIQDQVAEAVVAADIIIVAADSTEYPDDTLRRVAKDALKSKKPVILALNKSDLKGALDDAEFLRLGIKPIVRTSAEHNTGVADLRKTIISYLPTDSQRKTSASETLTIALIGRPNVGKSHLFNTLAGKQQAIVADVVGTTRDLNRTTVAYHGQSIELIDTAGIRKPGKQERGIEKFSVLRTLQAIEAADICLLLIDANELHVALDQKLAGMIADAGKGMILVVSKWDSVEDKDTHTHDALLPRIARDFDFVPWAPVIFTSALTGKNVAKLYEIATAIMTRRAQQPRTRQLNTLLQQAIASHPPAGLKNTHPRLRYIVHTDTSPPWFVVYGSDLKYLHWSYKRYLERQLREQFDYSGTPIKWSFRDEKQIKANQTSRSTGDTEHPAV